ncbi:hypothetical protein ACU635_59025 [[Actinomadura] parvosata]|uniref:hypothetical protein n=1 Tax=[Actinomadura] parvosata TaxID=1955412 RepID=UPI00406BF907
MTSTTRRRLATLTLTLLALPPAALSLTTPAHADAGACLAYLQEKGFEHHAIHPAACDQAELGNVETCMDLLVYHMDQSAAFEACMRGES